MTASSQYLPADFDGTGPIVVIAGREIYPKLTIDSIRRAGIGVRLIAFEGETNPEVVDSFSPEEVATVKVGQLGRMLNSLKRFQCRYAMMVGQVAPPRLFRRLHPDLKAIRVLARLKERNAETIFGAIADEIAGIGVELLDARAFLDHEIATPGQMTDRSAKIDSDAIQHGFRIAKEVARLDIGQSVVVRHGTVIAVEAFEGTDSMLKRAGQFHADDLILVKVVKPNQDYRFDVPVFGVRTLEVMSEAGISTGCLEAGSIIILEKDRVLFEARRRKIELLGIG